MKKVLLFLAGCLVFSHMAFAQEEETEDTGGSGTTENRFINELTIGGELRLDTQLSMDGTSYVRLGQSMLKFDYKFTQYSGVFFELQVGAFGGQWMGGDWSVEWQNPADDTLVKVNEANAWADILGELGVNEYVGLVFKIGKITGGPVFAAEDHALGFGFRTGDGDIYTVVMKDPWNINWEIPIHALDDVFPLTIYVQHDADFSRSNNDFSIDVDIKSGGKKFQINGEDKVALDWNIFYNYAGAAEVNKNMVSTGETGTDGKDIMMAQSEGSVKISQQVVGGSAGASYMITEDMKIGLALGVNYRMYTGAYRYSGVGVSWDRVDLHEAVFANGKDYLHQFRYTVGTRYTWNDMFRVNVAYHGDISLSPVYEGTPATAMNQSQLAFRFDYLGLKSSIGTEFYVGLSTDLRDGKSIAANFIAEDGEIPPEFSTYMRFGLDLGVAWEPFNGMRIHLGYFLGNMEGGANEDTHHWTMRGAANATGETNRGFGNHMYIKAGFWF